MSLRRSEIRLALIHRRTALWLMALAASAAYLLPAGHDIPGGRASTPPAVAHEIKIGNYFVNAPYGIAFIIDDETGFVIDPASDRPKGSRYGDKDPALMPPGVAAPDFSFFRAQFPRGDAQVRFTWGRVGGGAVAATLETDRPVELSLHLPIDIWPHFHAAYTPARDGLTGTAFKPRGGFVSFGLRADPAPAFVRANITPDAEIVFSLQPGTPTRFVAGIGELPPLPSVQPTLVAAERRYEAGRVAAEGDWGDFLGWGPLLCEIAVEALAGTGADFRPVPRQDGAIVEHVVLRHIPFGGRPYRIEARGGRVAAIPE